MSESNINSEGSDKSSSFLPGVTIVEASAGSGKTYALARRYIQLLICSREFNESAFRRVMAITFTNKATVEMKERILDLLKRISLEAFDRGGEFDELLALYGLAGKTARERALRIVDLLINQYNSFQVQTIDSFINALLLGSALNLGRSAHFKIQRGYQQYLYYVWDMVVDRSSEDKTVFSLLEEFLNHYLFVENRKGWFPKEDILKLMASFFSIVNKFGYVLKEYKNGGSSGVIRKKTAIYKKIKALLTDMPPGVNGNVKRNIENFIGNNAEIFDIRSLPRAFRNEEVPMNRNFSAPAGFERKWREISRELTGLVELDAAAAYSPYIRLFYLINGVFQKIAKKEDVIFLEELNQKARELFDEGGVTVAELYYCLAVRFKHYLIDEFQDTSSIQWSNLYPMIEDALSSGGTLFYVGDKKQAIYRFRGGDLRLFDRLKKDLSHFSVTVNSLRKNWRSEKVLVDFFNSVFSRDNLTGFINDSGIADELLGDTGAVEEITGIFDNSFQECGRGTNQGYVRIDKIEEVNKEERDLVLRPLIIDRLKELNERFPFEDIAVLTRDNTEAELLTSWLLEEGIPVESEKTLNVAENRLIKEIISLLGFLNSPIDDLNFAGFVMGDIFSSASGMPHSLIRDFIFSCRIKARAEDKSFPLYRMFREAYPDIWDAYLREFFQNVGFISLYELVIAVYRRFSVFSHFSNNQAFFMKFLDLIKETEEEYPGVNKFLSYLYQAPAEDLYVKVSRRSSVRILTVHKAKGLEFPVVIIPFLRVEINPETGGRKSSSYLECSEPPYAGILRITRNHRYYSGFLNQVYSRAFKKACVDELNNLYVALTRARFELYAFIPKKSGPSVNKAGYFIDGEILERGVRKHSSSYYRKGKEEQNLLSISPPLYKDWILSLYDEIRDAVPLNKREEKYAGTVAHFFLSCLGNMKDRDYNLIMNVAREKTGNKYPYFEKLRSLEETVSRLVGRECLRGFFYVSDGDVYCEQEVIDMNGNSKRIDRLIVKKDDVWVIDYKNSPDLPEEHREQVREYLDIVKGIYPGRKARGFIIYLTGDPLISVE